MSIWNYNDGSRYRPAGDVWTPTTTNNPPSPRYNHTAVWTGSQMLVFGGATNGAPLGDTWAYTPGPPFLSIAATATNTLAVTWPNVGSAWHLHSSGSPETNNADWVERTYASNATSCWFIEPRPTSNVFYRLLKP